MTLRIVEVVGSLAVGGAERVALEVAAGMHARGLQSSLLVCGPDSRIDESAYRRSLKAEAEERGVPVTALSFGGLGDAAGRKRVLDFLRESGTELLHVHNRPQDWQLVVVAALAGIPAMYTVHLPYPHARPTHNVLYGAIGRASAAVVCVSRAVADHVARTEGVPRSLLRVIYNGIRMERFAPPAPEERARMRKELGVEDGDFMWLCAARLADQKGHVHLVDAMARLPPDSKARLLLAGEGDLEAALRDQVKRLSLERRVTFLGPRRDVPALLGAADGYACSSRQEGHPLSLLEAMATELPVVAPRLPPIEEIAMPGAPVFYGPKHGGWAGSHDPAEMAEALLAVERAPEEHRKVARASREHVARTYSLTAMLDQHEALYREITSGGGNRTPLRSLLGLSAQLARPFV